jgi:predicted TIM-barrel fold metal-dependent hydrolase
MRSSRASTAIVSVALGCVAITLIAAAAGALAQKGKPARGYLLNDSHVHLTNYIQEGTALPDFLDVMGKQVGRAVLFGIPLQQQWSHRVSGADAPTYYLETDADLYYYSFTDAYIAMAYRALEPAQQARLDPMITGFNPADMYAADHIRRVLATFPGVFVGIGEFTVHKEFVSAKVAGDVPSLTDPALDRILDLAEEAGLVVLIHCDADTPFPREGAEPTYVAPLLALFRRHPDATIVWAHVGVGRVVRPIEDHGAMVEEILEDPSLAHVHFDLSWAETAKYLVASPEALERAEALIERHPDRFLFGTDEVAPTDPKAYLAVHRQYAPLWKRLDEKSLAKVLAENHARIFDKARTEVRAWEKRQAAGAKASSAAPRPAQPGDGG